MLKTSDDPHHAGADTCSCGLDFGTSNSTVALVRAAEPRLVPVEGDKPTIPSAVFFSSARRDVAFGRAAITRYTDGEVGRFMRAIKSILGHGLFHEKTPIQGKQVALSKVLTLFLAHLKGAADDCAGADIRHAVLGRPVQFIENDPPADRQAQDDLESAARAVGFRNIEFQYEPIAAALDYELRVPKEELVFVVDIGGGTADFSIVRVSPEKSRQADRRGDILANRGVRVGGTDFDQMLSLIYVMPLLGLGSHISRGKAELPKWIYHDLSTWSQIPFLYSQKVKSVLRSIRYDAARPDLGRPAHRRHRPSGGTPDHRSGGAGEDFPERDAERRDGSGTDRIRPAGSPRPPRPRIGDRSRPCPHREGDCRDRCRCGIGPGRDSSGVSHRRQLVHADRAEQDRAVLRQRRHQGRRHVRQRRKGPGLGCLPEIQVGPKRRWNERAPPRYFSRAQRSTSWWCAADPGSSHIRSLERSRLCGCTACALRRIREKHPGRGLPIAPGRRRTFGWKTGFHST
jgi:hypothetical protein